MNIIKDIIQGTIASGYGVGMSAANLVRETMGFNKVDDYDNTAGVSQFFLGDEPVESLGKQMRLAPERASALTGISQDKTKYFAAPAVLGLAMMDFLPGGSGAKSFTKSLAKANKTEDVADLLKTMKVPESEIPTLSTRIAATKSTKEIDTMLRETYDKKWTRGFNASAPKEYLKDDGTKMVQSRFNVERFNMTPDKALMVRGLRSQQGLDDIPMQTFDDWQRTADELGYRNVDEFLEGLRKLDGKTPARIVNEGRIIDNLAQNFIETDALAKEGLTETFSRNKALDDLNRAIAGTSQAATNIGRALAAHRVLAKHTLDKGFWFRQAFRNVNKKMTSKQRQALDEFIQTNDGSILTKAKINQLDADQLSAINGFIERGDRLGLAEYVASLKKADLVDWIVEGRRAGLLTNPRSHVKNLFGTGISTAAHTLSRIPAVALDIPVSWLTGQRTVTVGAKTIATKVGAARKGVKSAGNFLRTGRYDADLMKKYDFAGDINFGTKGFPKYFSQYVNGVYRALGAEDIIFREMAIQEALVEGAIVTAKNDGLRGAAKQARIKELLQKPTAGMLEDAVNAAEYQTFTKGNAFADFVNIGKKQLPRGAEAAVDIVLPFKTTPSNVAEMVFDYTPLGLGRALFRAVNPATRSQKDFVERFGRAALGTGFMAIGYQLAQKGMATTDAPRNESQRADFYAQGKIPNAIMLGGDWYQINQASPMGNLINVGAMLYADGANKNFSDRSAEATAFGLKSLADMTFLEGIGSMLDVVEGDSSAADYMYETASSFIPSIVFAVRRVEDPVVRRPEGLADEFANKLPLLSDEVAPLRDVFGYKVTNPNDLASVFINPMNHQKVSDNPVIKEAERLNVTIGIPSKARYGIRMSEAEYSEYQRVQGTVLEAALTDLVESPEYQMQPDAAKELLLTRKKEKVREEVGSILFPEIVKKRYELPPEVSNEQLTEVLQELRRNQKQWIEASDDRKKQILQDIFT